MGVSRRIPAVPKGFELGKTVVYLAHRRGQYRAHVLGCAVFSLKTDECNCGAMEPVVITAFVPKAIEYVVKGTETEEELLRLEDRGIDLVEVHPQQQDLPGTAT